MYLDNTPVSTDTTPPTLSVSVTNGTTYSSSKTAVITISDSSAVAPGTYTIKYAWGTSYQSCSSMSNSESITVKANTSSVIMTVTISGYNGAGKIYVCNSSAISDSEGNTASSGTLTDNADMYLENAAVNTDTTPPTIDTFYIGGSTNPSSTTSTSTTTYLKWSDSDVESYCIRTSNSSSSCSWTSLTSTQKSNKTLNNSYTLSSGNGTKILYAFLKDTSGNISASKSDSIMLSVPSSDTTPPTLTCSLSNSDWTKNSVTFTASATDSGDGFSYLKYSSSCPVTTDVSSTTVSSSCSWGSSKITSVPYSTSVSKYGVVGASAYDKADNSAACYKLVKYDNLKPYTPVSSDKKYIACYDGGSQFFANNLPETTNDVICYISRDIWEKYNVVAFSFFGDQPSTSTSGISGVDYCDAIVHYKDNTTCTRRAIGSGKTSCGLDNVTYWTVTCTDKAGNVSNTYTEQIED